MSVSKDVGKWALGAFTGGEVVTVRNGMVIYEKKINKKKFHLASQTEIGTPRFMVCSSIICKSQVEATQEIIDG